MVFNPFIWTADQLLVFREVPTDHKNTVYSIQNRSQGVSRALMRLILGQITIFVHSVALDRLQSLHLYCWQTSNVETLFTDHTNQFLILEITLRGSPGGHWGHLRGILDQKFCFLAVWSCYTSVNPFTWTDDQLFILRHSSIDHTN